MAKSQEERNREHKYELCRQHAISQGLGIIQLSARRYAVVSISGGLGFWAGCNGKYYTNLGCEKVHGPATWRSCKNYIAQNSQCLPDKIIHI